MPTSMSSKQLNRDIPHWYSVAVWELYAVSCIKSYSHSLLMGSVSTATFAMVAACIIRRKQLLNLGLPDPFLGISGAIEMNGASVGGQIWNL